MTHRMTDRPADRPGWSFVEQWAAGAESTFSVAPSTADLPPPLPIDQPWMERLLVQLLRIPSPTGRTDAVARRLVDVLHSLGVPVSLGRSGTLRAHLETRTSTSPGRILAVHVDTIGAMVADLKDNGRLSVIPVGSHPARTAEGARCQILCDDDRSHAGTVLPLAGADRTSDRAGERAGAYGWDRVEVRVDDRARCTADLAALGIQVGDFVAFDADPVITPTGYLTSRHLGAKAGVATALGVVKAVVDSGVQLPHPVDVVVAVSGQLGGRADGLQDGAAEAISIAGAACAPDGHGLEDGITIPMADTRGPLDFHLTRRLCELCRRHDLPYARDAAGRHRAGVTAPSAADTAAADRADAGAGSGVGGTRVGVVAFGVDAGGGHERTHLRSLLSVAQLLSAYVQTDLGAGSLSAGSLSAGSLSAGGPAGRRRAPAAAAPTSAGSRPPHR